MGAITDSFEQRLQRWKNPSWWNLLICFPWAVGVAFGIYTYTVDRAIAVREMTVTGVITTHDPPNHDRYGYSFVVLGKSYFGWQIPDRSELVIGQPVVVYYDPLNPEKSSLVDFEELSFSGFGLSSFALVGIGTVTTIIFVLRRHHQTSLSRQTP
jgi:hypothetical protein